MASKSLPSASTATTATPSAAEIGDRKSAFKKIASAVPLIPVVILEGADGLVVVESGCGAVAVGSAYLFPPLSSDGASIAEPWLRFHTPLIEPDVRY